MKQENIVMKLEYTVMKLEYIVMKTTVGNDSTPFPLPTTMMATFVYLSLS